MPNHEKLCCLKKERKCRRCGVYCEHPNYEEIGWMIDTIESYIVSECLKEMEYKQNGYVFGVCDYSPKTKDNQISCLISYRKVLQKMWDLLNSGSNSDYCLCFDSWACLKDKVLSIVGKIKMDASSQKVEKLDNDWLLNNPGATTFERWERGLYAVVPVLEYYVEAVKKEEKEFLFEVIREEDQGKDIVFEAIRKAEKKIGIEIETTKVEERIGIGFESKIVESGKEIEFTVRKVQDSKPIEIEVTKQKELAKEVVVEAIKSIKSYTKKI